MRTAIMIPMAILLLPAASAAQTNGADQDRIANALSAAPASVAEHAAVSTMDGRTIRPGTNGWVCLPDDPAVPNNSPMCLDAAWLGFVDALMNRRTPRVTRLGIGYMLQGDMPVSNTDPYATGPTADNDWIADGPPHIMIVVPDAKLLDGFPTDPRNGGPWVMWKGTPYAHLMVPTPKRGN